MNEPLLLGRLLYFRKCYRTKLLTGCLAATFLDDFVVTGIAMTRFAVIEGPERKRRNGSLYSTTVKNLYGTSA